MPNLNGRPFLPERLRTITAQTVSDWELIVVDNYSEDGAWEYFQEQARNEPRMKISQAPKEGMYANWNNCLRLATGEFVYIATSDDTMAPDCLRQLIDALDRYPDCDLAHCPLRVINEAGQVVQFDWERTSVFARSSGEFLNQLHIRKAPFDGVLHLSGESVYISITQLLIRRSLFGRVGLFENKWGSMGDFNWAMRASLVANTVHVPATWGGWRIHAAQATNLDVKRILSERRKIEDMIDHAIEASRIALPEKVNQLLQKRRQYFWQRWEFDHLMRERTDLIFRLRFLFRSLMKRSVIGWCYLGRRLLGLHGWDSPPVEVVSRWLNARSYTTIEKAEAGTRAPDSSAWKTTAGTT